MEVNVDLIVNVYNTAIGARPTSPLETITKLLTEPTESESLSSSASADCDKEPCNRQSYARKSDVARARLVKALSDYKQTPDRTDATIVCPLCDQWTPPSSYARTLFALAKTIQDVNVEHPEILAEFNRVVDLPNLLLAIEWYYNVVKGLRVERHVCLTSAKVYRGVLLPFHFRTDACETIQASQQCLKSLFDRIETTKSSNGSSADGKRAKRDK